MASDAWGTVNEALAQLRATYGRLPELDQIERSAACVENERRQLEATVDVIWGALLVLPRPVLPLSVQADLVRS